MKLFVLQTGPTCHCGATQMLVVAAEDEAKARQLAARTVDEDFLVEAECKELTVPERQAILWDSYL